MNSLTPFQITAVTLSTLFLCYGIPAITGARTWILRSAFSLVYGQRSKKAVGRASRV